MLSETAVLRVVAVGFVVLLLLFYSTPATQADHCPSIMASLSSSAAQSCLRPDYSTLGRSEVHIPHGWECISDGDVKTLSLKRANLAGSQNGEDMELLKKYFGGMRGGTFMELGALDGQTYSNTLFFEQHMGWHGVLIEANPDLFEKLQKDRFQSVAVHAAVCGEERVLHWASNRETPAVNGLIELMSAKHRARWFPKVQVQTLPVVRCMPMRTILSRVLGIPRIHFDFVSLDVEGGELDVLKSVDWDAMTVDVWMVESDGTAPENEKAVNALLRERGFKLVREHFLNSNWFERCGWRGTTC